MNTKHNNIGKISLLSGIVTALAFAVYLPGATQTAQQTKEAKQVMQMDHIMTQAQAEALKPGDSMAMTCSKCKTVTVQKVTKDKAHVKMMTVGEKLMCHTCEGTVEIVATGKGTGKDAEVKHICSKCGDDAMFCAATKPGSGSMKDMKDMKDMK